MDTYIARICWNTNDWVFPSGEAQNFETDSFVSEKGFGHEEWLLNFAWLLKGFHYAFLQPVGNSYKKLQGQTVDIVVYSINPNRERIYIGKIHRCEVLTEPQALEAFRFYKKSGWLKEMKEQLKSIQADLDTLDSPLSTFNVRFRPADFERYDPFKIDASIDPASRTFRYTLMRIDDKELKAIRTGREGSGEPPSIRTVTRAGHEGVTFDPIEKALQRELLLLLQKKYGKENVKRETKNVDLTIKTGQNVILVELKSDGDARMAIRKALGQILEYAYFQKPAKLANLSLAIVSPGPLTDAAKQYIAFLRKEFDIPVSYARFALGDSLPAIF